MGETMKAEQFTVGGVTYETRQLSIGDAINADWLGNRFLEMGYNIPLTWRRAQAYTNFLITTRVVSGDTPAWMIDIYADNEALIAGLDAFLAAPRNLNVVWSKTRTAVEREDNDEELSPLAIPND
jgi:hypothetical protein